MALKFGTSGVRGLVSDMTDRECFLYTLAFLRYVRTKSSPQGVAIAGDRRKSTPRILEAVAFAAHQEGLRVDSCGLVPTPAVTVYGLKREMPSIMVTGSHIPEDRNGIKYNMPWGEVLKTDEAEISRRYRDLEREEAARIRDGTSDFTDRGDLRPREGIRTRPGESRRRAGLRREARHVLPRRLPRGPEGGLLPALLCLSTDPSGDASKTRGPGGRGGRVGNFSCPSTPRPWQRPKSSPHGSPSMGRTPSSPPTGMGTGPSVIDEKGNVVRGDVLGILVADFLEADSVSAPVSCNTALEKSGRFRNVDRTRIGFPTSSSRC